MMSCEAGSTATSCFSELSCCAPSAFTASLAEGLLVAVLAAARSHSGLVPMCSTDKEHSSDLSGVTRPTSGRTQKIRFLAYFRSPQPGRNTKQTMCQSG